MPLIQSMLTIRNMVLGVLPSLELGSYGRKMRLCLGRRVLWPTCIVSLPAWCVSNIR